MTTTKRAVCSFFMFCPLHSRPLGGNRVRVHEDLQGRGIYHARSRILSRCALKGEEATVLDAECHVLADIQVPLCVGREEVESPDGSRQRATRGSYRCLGVAYVRFTSLPRISCKSDERRHGISLPEAPTGRCTLSVGPDVPLFRLDHAAASAERADHRLDARRPFDAVQPLGIEQPQHPNVAQILFEGVHLGGHTNILKRLVIYSQSELSTGGTRGYDPFPGD